MDKIGNAYGAAHTPETLVDMIGGYLQPTDNNLCMRQQLSSWGFNRVPRDFASKVMELIGKLEG